MKFMIKRSKIKEIWKSTKTERLKKGKRLNGMIMTPKKMTGEEMTGDRRTIEEIEMTDGTGRIEESTEEIVEGMIAEMIEEMIEEIEIEMIRDQTGINLDSIVLQKVIKAICHKIHRKWINLIE